MQFRTLEIHLTCFLGLMTISTSLPKNQYLERWYDTSSGSEISKVTHIVYNPSKSEVITPAAENDGFAFSHESAEEEGRKELKQKGLQTFRSRPRWYDARVGKPEKSQEPQQILQVILQPEMEKKDRLLHQNSKYGARDAITHGKVENYDNQMTQRYPPNLLSSHNRSNATRSNHRISTMAPDLTKRPKTENTKQHRLEQRTEEENSKSLDTFVKPEELEIRIVTQREVTKETQRRSPIQDSNAPPVQQVQPSMKPNPSLRKPVSNIVNRTSTYDTVKPVSRRPPSRPQAGEIVFPDGKKHRRFLPSSGKCADGNTFCEKPEDEYPSDYINELFQRNGEQFRGLFGNDVISEPNVTQRIDVSDENPMCPSIEHVVYPKQGQNKNEKWMYIINQDSYVQGVRVETCLRDGECLLTEGFPLGYTTSCKQKYIYRKMVSLNEEGMPTTDDFRLPSCCSCFVKQDTTARAGVLMPSKNPMTPARPKRRRRR